MRGVLVLYCKTSHPKPYWLQTAIFYYYSLSQFCGLSRFRWAHSLVISMWLQGDSGWGGSHLKAPLGWMSRMAYTWGWQWCSLLPGSSWGCCPEQVSLCTLSFSNLGSLIPRESIPKGDILKVLGRNCKTSHDLTFSSISAAFCWSNKPLTQTQIQEERNETLPFSENNSKESGGFSKQCCRTGTTLLPSTYDFIVNHVFFKDLLLILEPIAAPDCSWLQQAETH